MKTPDDIPDGTERFYVGDDSERLRNLLAVLHRDGGHHVAAVGVEQACVDATKIFYDGLDAVLSAERTRDELNDARNVLSDELTRVTRERDALRAIVEGRTTPPSDEEIAAHEAAGGLWRCPNADRQAMGGPRARVARTVDARMGHVTTWWPLDTHGRPCAWPVVDR